MSKEYLEALNNLYDISCNIQNTTKDYEFLKNALAELKAIKESNPSDALKLINIFLKCFGENDFLEVEIAKEDINTIEQALLKAQELESENNALLEENKDLYVELAFSEKQYKELIECTNQYKKVLEIIKEKQVNISLLRYCLDEWVDSLYQYNKRTNIEKFKLTQEEFDLLKSWLDNRKKE